MKTRILSITLLLLATFAANAGSVGTLKQVLNNGSNASHINIVILGDGYTAGQNTKFDTDSLTMLNFLLADQFYREYAGYFNAFTIFVASNESGSDHPENGTSKDTYFDSTYNFMGIDRLLALPSSGQSKVNELLQDLMPEHDIVIMLVNDIVYGGSGGPIAVTSLDPGAQDIVVHELGHSFADLDDEYDDETPGYPDIEKANTTRDTNRATIKWKHFIAAQTPVPTPETSQYESVVGLFEGAHYHATGWFRPKLDCKMNHLNVPFCDVCVEASIKAIYGKVSPVASKSPASSAISLNGTGKQTLSIEILTPATHSLTVQWTIDGAPVSPSATTSLEVSAPALGNGPHSVVVTVTDSTPFVLNDPQKILQDTITWTINVTQAAPAITSPLTAVIDEGSFFQYQIRATGSPGSFTATGLPAGLSVDASGLITGATDAVGDNPVTISATNSFGTGSATLVLTVRPVPVLITSALTATATQNAAFTYIITATAKANATITYSAQLPSGFTVDPSTGVISGTFPLAGAVNFNISAGTSSGSDTQALTVSIAKAGGGSNTPPVISSAISISPSAPLTAENVAFSATASDADGDLLAYRWEFGDGTFAIGDSVSHAFSAAGVYLVRVTVSDGAATVERTDLLAVNNTQPASALIVSKVAIKLNFAAANKDTLQVSGTVPVTIPFTPVGKPVSFSVGELRKDVELDAKGGVADKSIKFTGKLSKGVFVASPLKFAIALKNKSLLSSLDAFGFVNATISPAAALSLPVSISLNGQNLVQTVNLSFTAKLGKTGSAKIAK